MSIVIMDREVLRSQAPKVYKFLSHQIIDVTSLDIVQWGLPALESAAGCKGFASGNHRAMTDIEASLAKMKWYHKWLRDKIKSIQRRLKSIKKQNKGKESRKEQINVALPPSLFNFGSISEYDFGEPRPSRDRIVWMDLEMFSLTDYRALECAVILTTCNSLEEIARKSWVLATSSKEISCEVMGGAAGDLSMRKIRTTTDCSMNALIQRSLANSGELSSFNFSSPIANRAN